MDKSAQRPVTRRPAFVIGAVVAVLVLAIVATWIIAWKVQSPAQREAAKKPPTPTAITVAIEKGDLQDTTTTAATPRAAEQQRVNIPVAGDTAVVSKQGVAQGKRLGAGAPVLWINGRPLIALEGAVPMWRDLHQGDKGPDVAALQKGLRSAGLHLAVDGIFGAGTAKSLTALYKRYKIAPPAAPAPAPADTAADGGDAGKGSGQEADGQQPSAAPKPAQNGGPLASRNELIFLPSLPATLQQVPALGTTLSGENAWFGLASGAPVLVASVDGTTAARLSVGMTAHAQLDDGDIPLTLSSLDNQEKQPQGEDGQADGGGQSATQVTFTATDKSGALAKLEPEAPVSVQIDLATPIKDALIVPERAVAAAKDGSSSILLAADKHQFRLVAVTVLGCANGNCAIQSKDQAVAPGALVRVDR